MGQRERTVLARSAPLAEKASARRVPQKREFALLEFEQFQWVGGDPDRVRFQLGTPLSAVGSGCCETANPAGDKPETNRRCRLLFYPEEH